MKSIGHVIQIQNELFFRSNGVSFDASSLPLEANFATPQSLGALDQSCYRPHRKLFNFRCVCVFR